MPFCPQCKSMVYPRDGRLSCRKCDWSGSVKGKSRMVQSHTATAKEAVVIESSEDVRQQQDTECPKCGHNKAYFHLMQTRRSDEPPTEINQCVKCGHSWREYG